MPCPARRLLVGIAMGLASCGQARGPTSPRDSSDTPLPRHLADASGIADTSFNHFLASGGKESYASGLPLPGSDRKSPAQMGPVFVVWLTYKGAKPARTKEEIRSLLTRTDAPSLGDVVSFSSWGQSTLEPADVEMYEMESEDDPAIWVDKGQAAFLPAWEAVKKQPLYASGLNASLKKLGISKFNRFMLYIPAGPKDFQATAWYPGTESIYMATAIDWKTASHEVGRNWGLGPAGGFLNDTSGARFEKYADDAIMGFQRLHRHADFTAVARKNLGWISKEQAADFPHKKVVSLRALNEGPKFDGKFLIMAFDCPKCKPGDPTNKKIGGTVYASYRVKDPNSRYGITDGAGLCQHTTYKPLLLADRVHLHFQSKAGGNTELWTTLDEAESYKLPDANLTVHVCRRSDDALSQTAVISASTKSASDAVALCPAVKRPKAAAAAGSIPLTTTEPSAGSASKHVARSPHRTFPADSTTAALSTTAAWQGVKPQTFSPSPWAYFATSAPPNPCVKIVPTSTTNPPANPCAPQLQAKFMDHNFRKTQRWASIRQGFAVKPLFFGVTVFGGAFLAGMVVILRAFRRWRNSRGDYASADTSIPWCSEDLELSPAMDMVLE